MASRKATTKETTEVSQQIGTEQKSRKPRIEVSPETKAKVAVAAIIGEKSIAEIAEEFKVSNQNVTSWQNTALQAIVDRFQNPPRRGRAKSAVESKEINRTDSILQTLDSLFTGLKSDSRNLAHTDQAKD